MVDYDAPSGGTVTVYTDMPGTAMAVRVTYPLPATVGRQTKNVPLDGTEGTLIKVKWSSGAVLRLYAATLRLRPIGVYIDGTNNEFWETGELGFGI